MPEIDIAQLPFLEAIDYFVEKTAIDTDTWRDTHNLDTNAAFTVAAAKGDLLQDIRDDVTKAQADGLSTQDFLKSFDSIADRYSPDWLGKGNRAWRGQLIYEQNIRQSHAAGRYEQMTEPDMMKLRPYWQWRHGDSRDPRPSHLALNGMVFEAGKLPMSPPCGFNCRCQVFSLSRRDLVRKGLEVSSLKRGDEINGIVIEPDEGFDRTIEKVRKDTLNRFDPTIRKQVEKEIGTAEFKLPEGMIKEKDGVKYVLTNSRWNRVDDVVLTDTPAKIKGWLLKLDSEPEIQSTAKLWEQLEAEADVNKTDKIMERIDKIYAQNKNIKEGKEGDHLKLMQGLREELLSSGLSREKATSLVDNIDFSSLSKQEQKDTKAHAAEFLQITNGRGSAWLKGFNYTDERASADNISNTINIGEDSDKTTIFHEMAHFAESETWDIRIHKLNLGEVDKKHVNIYQRYKRWIKNRATGNPETLYAGSNEKGYPDKFVDPYVGKIYDSATEVLSMGLQHFESPESMVELWKKDKQHFKLMTNFLQEARDVQSKS